MKDRGVEVIHILLTHEHFDHTVGVPVLQQAFPQNDLFCQEEAEKYISSKRGNNPMLIAFVLAEQDKKTVAIDISNSKQIAKPILFMLIQHTESLLIE